MKFTEWLRKAVGLQVAADQELVIKVAEHINPEHQRELPVYDAARDVDFILDFTGVDFEEKTSTSAESGEPQR